MSADMSVEEEKVKERVLTFLRDNDIPFECLTHRGVMTIDEGATFAERLGVNVCKCLFLRNRSGGHFLLMTRGEKRSDLKIVAAAIASSRLSFASEEETAEILACHRGSVSVLGLLYDTHHKARFLIDRALLHTEYVCCHPCVNTCTVKLKTTDLLRRFLPATGHESVAVDIEPSARDE